MTQRITFDEARVASGLSAGELARRAGVSRYTVLAVSRGDHRPQYSSAVRLSRALGVDPREIYEFAPVVAELEEATA